MPEANANPDKRFFIDLITRDISLEDAILDLIDNAVDSLVRTKHIDLYKDFLDTQHRRERPEILPEIKVNFSTKQFRIEDNCGGITFERAEKEIFRFGHPDPHRGPSLSVFGIGMKRAIFKIGRQIEIESRASDSGFFMSLNADAWLRDQTTDPSKQTSDWKIPIDKKEGEKNPVKAGTKIVITRLREEVATLTQNPVFQNRLIKTIQETYPFYLGIDVRIVVNGKEVESLDLSFGESQYIRPSIESWEDDNVRATLICGLLPREEGPWTFDKSGWYLLCNGRVIVHADKTKLTGWGGGSLPQFMPKNRGFLGIVFFHSDHPEELPWNTRKRDVNSESPVYIRSLKRMVAAAKLVVQFQNKIYEATERDEPKEEYRDSVRGLQTSSATKHAAQRGLATGPTQTQAFAFSPPPNPPKLTTIQFKVKIEELARAKKRLGRASMPNYEVGEQIFRYFFDRECSQ
jgi:hypothetical protein